MHSAAGNSSTAEMQMLRSLINYAATSCSDTTLFQEATWSEMLRTQTKVLGKASDAKRPHCLNFFSLRELLRRDCFTGMFFFLFFFFSSAPSEFLTSSMTVS